MHLNINENGAQFRTCAGRDTAPLNIGLLPVLGLGLFQILFQMHSFSNNNIVFSGEG